MYKTHVNISFQVKISSKILPQKNVVEDKHKIKYTKYKGKVN